MLKSKENELVFTLSPLLIKCARIIHTIMFLHLYRMFTDTDQSLQ